MAMEVSKTDLSTRGEAVTANTVKQIVRPNPRRISLLLINTSATDAYISERDNVTTSGSLIGILLKANAGNAIAFSSLVGTDGLKRVYDGQIYATSTANVTIMVAEESEVA